MTFTEYGQAPAQGNRNSAAGVNYSATEGATLVMTQLELMINQEISQQPRQPVFNPNNPQPQPKLHFTPGGGA
jgi:hypothetical protein